MKKFGNFMFAICIILLISVSVVVKPVNNLDEVWNFNIARCICNGLVPYKDISMVSTPLTGFISAIPLKLWGQEMFYLRVLAIVISLICIFLVFKIFNQLEIKREVANIFAIIMSLLLLNNIYADHNLLILLLVLQIILLELKVVKKQYKSAKITNIVIGILGGLAICTKQSMGFFISMAIVCIPLFNIKKKQDIIPRIREILIRAIGITIPVDILLIYLGKNGAINDFLDYSVNGIKTFSNSISYRDFFMSSNNLYKILAIIFPIIIILTIVVGVILKVKKKEKPVEFILSIYSLAMYSLVFPIANRMHFRIACITSCILVVYNIGQIYKIFIAKYKKHDFKYFWEFVRVCSILIVLVGTLCFEYKYNESLGMISKYDYQKHFRYINIPAELNKSITEINEFSAVKEKKVYILDASASAYMIPIDRYNKNYDMFLVGNLGSGGEEAIIEKIKNEDALYFIMKDEYKLYWQNPQKVRAYIKENMELVDSRSYFDIYQNKPKIEETIEENTGENVEENSESQQ